MDLISLIFLHRCPWNLVLTKQVVDTQSVLIICYTFFKAWVLTTDYRKKLLIVLTFFKGLCTLCYNKHFCSMLTSDKQEYDVLLILYRTEWKCVINHKCVHYMTIYGILNCLVFQMLCHNFGVVYNQQMLTLTVFILRNLTT